MVIEWNTVIHSKDVLRVKPSGDQHIPVAVGYTNMIVNLPDGDHIDDTKG